MTTTQAAGAADIEVLLFDFDGTLMDTEWSSFVAWCETYEEFGQVLQLEEYVKCIGSDFTAWSPKTHLEELIGQTLPWEERDPVREARFRELLAENGRVPGVEGVLENLAGRYRMGVVSSSSHKWVDGWLEELGLMRFFERTICRGDAPRIKPAPDLYLEAARQFEVEPASCLVIEDSQNGTHSGKLAGMTVHAVPNRVTQVSDFSEADEVFDSLTSFGEALQERALPDAEPETLLSKHHG